MNLRQLKPRKALNKAYLKLKPNREEINDFKKNLIQLLDSINKAESEEYHKKLINYFLRETYYKPDHFINTKGWNDLVIHNGKDHKSSVGVIIETKNPLNKSEMITRSNINAEAFHELLLYYLRERITNNNLEIRHLIITNIHEWYIFDANVFERNFAQNKQLIKQFKAFETGKLSGTKTEFFYNEIAQPFIESLSNDIEYTYFDIREYNEPLRNSNPKDDNKLIALFKLLSPEHLLKLPFANDSNTLDKRFYGELLYIMGLTETKEGGKKIIERNKERKRNIGSIFENAINELDSMDRISRLDRPSQFGDNIQERLFNVALELCITWMNRVLFMKLLEAQLIKYHKGDSSYEFLNIKKITNYDDLNSLFFKVLARKLENRGVTTKDAFQKVPYLNSSLFEPTELEHTTMFVSNLSASRQLPIYDATVLKDKQGKRRTGEMNSLEYLFEFLDAYDFTSEGSEEIQEDNKTLINASVLGLIFEKINGYKDGSFFTPGFITMYMCRETIRKAVLQKFSEVKGWKCENMTQLYNKIDDTEEANEIVNSLKICDPAVGSGHFLVSALNEIIAIKNDLRILNDRQGRRLKEYNVEVENDELIVTDEDGVIFEYNPTSRESQRIQEALFHEKQTIIENCLFGVDINPNSVKICRLRLWIEMLKNAYYKNDVELETLPNIDINIKCGNSLVSRFALDANLGKALKKSKWSIDSYRLAVSTYRNARNREEKQEMERLMTDIKNDFRSEIASNDPKLARLHKAKGQLFTLTNQVALFEQTKKEKSKWNKKVEKHTKEISKLEAEIEEIKNNKIYENAFEWRFEFSEVLNEEGDFVGFDVVIGNPPYGVKLKTEEKEYFHLKYKTEKSISDTYLLFISQGLKIVRETMTLTYIIPSTWIYMTQYEKFRSEFLRKYHLSTLVHFKNQIFSDATVETSIIQVYKTTPTLKDNIEYIIKESDEIIKKQNLNQHKITDQPTISFLLSNDIVSALFQKISTAPKLGEIAKVVCGLTPYRKGKGKPAQSEEVVKGRVFNSKYQKDITFRQYIMGRDFNRYTFQIKEERWLSYGDWLAEPRRSAPFNNNMKIVVRQTADKIIAHIDENKFLSLKNVHNIKLINNSYSYEYVLGLLNSKLLNWWYMQLIPEQGRVFAEVKVVNLKKVPIKNTNNYALISSTVRQIINLKKIDIETDTTTLESEIDQLVYELYGLTEEEIGVVENA